MRPTKLATFDDIDMSDCEHMSEVDREGTLQLRRVVVMTHNGGLTAESEAVRNFMLAAGQPVRDVPTAPPDEEVRKRARFLIEEVQEALESMFDVPDGGSMHYAFKLIRMAFSHYSVKVDLPNLARELTDISYVTIGTQLTFGLPKEACFDEVAEANHRKVADGTVLEGGKVVKPAGWTPPDLEKVLRAHGWTGGGE